MDLIAYKTVKRKLKKAKYNSKIYLGDEMKVEYGQDGVHIKEAPCFSSDLIFDCGQAFRFSKNARSNWQGVAFGRVLEVSQNSDEIVLLNQSKEDYERIWRDYFDLQRDYDEILDRFCCDELLQRSAEENYGIRLLRQQPWETLCSFIISQNNNIPRIKGIIDRLCKTFGEKIDEENYSFPEAEVLASLEPEDLAPIRAGFRNKYIIDAARKVTSGEVDLKSLYSLSLDEAQQELLKIKGVGAKVAQCVLLFAYGKQDAFPVDVWVKRVMTLYPQGLPEEVSDCRGIVQQYLFHYIRLHPQIQTLTEVEKAL